MSPSDVDGGYNALYDFLTCPLLNINHFKQMIAVKGVEPFTRRPINYYLARNPILRVDIALLRQVLVTLKQDLKVDVSQCYEFWMEAVRSNNIEFYQYMRDCGHIEFPTPQSDFGLLLIRLATTPNHLKEYVVDRHLIPLPRGTKVLEAVLQDCLAIDNNNNNVVDWLEKVDFKRIVETGDLEIYKVLESFQEKQQKKVEKLQTTKRNHTF
ncbi:hypothetical protein DFA_07135 [Cavenderia fasciculata]|uniref:Uncharacterized protein n=1 Tax=Cavenderia fasciculata TaxID=261658 RepID=F4PVK5_CACFS|nr:uncharacterized protein DFA_07135 [Cavenderia fasciculata]EGG20019.1 hypothetical protein DFA_07135 [Cavenderia fasciculata]|eukprot:XP_004367002.1 hypothetical protein DFA_07135 [Cavenderia fasciculata]